MQVEWSDKCGSAPLLIKGPFKARAPLQRSPAGPQQPAVELIALRHLQDRVRSALRGTHCAIIASCSSGLSCRPCGTISVRLAFLSGLCSASARALAQPVGGAGIDQPQLQAVLAPSSRATCSNANSCAPTSPTPACGRSPARRAHAYKVSALQAAASAAASPGAAVVGLLLPPGGTWWPDSRSRSSRAPSSRSLSISCKGVARTEARQSNGAIVDLRPWRSPAALPDIQPSGSRVRTPWRCCS